MLAVRPHVFDGLDNRGGFGCAARGRRGLTLGTKGSGASCAGTSTGAGFGLIDRRRLARRSGTRNTGVKFALQDDRVASVLDRGAVRVRIGYMDRQPIAVKCPRGSVSISSPELGRKGPPRPVAQKQVSS